tara:strand:- start:31 stop:291 length:261 start_codon:yes stop_codon:yes gene_type:complete
VDYQTLFNIVLGAFSFLAGFMLNSIWQEIRGLQAQQGKAIDRLNSIEVLVAGNYITRAEFSRTMEKLFEKVDGITVAVSAKADRSK